MGSERALTIKGPATLICVDCDAVWDYQKTRTGKWVGTCEALQSIIQSDTLETLVEDIQETMVAVFSDLEDSGELDQLAHEQGWTVNRTPLETGKQTQGDSSFHVSRTIVQRSGHVAA